MIRAITSQSELHIDTSEPSALSTYLIKGTESCMTVSLYNSDSGEKSMKF